MSECVRPRLGFLGLGWIGRHRLRAIADADLADIVALADADSAARAEAAALTPHARMGETLEDVLSVQPDGVVIATPSALHAEHCLGALAAGAAVFCQKPLGRCAGETRAIIEAARRGDRLLAVDLSYRYTEGLARIRDLARSGAIGEVYAVDLTFHNAYGPDRAWFYDAAQSGGGCLLDLGTHLVDFLHWTFDAPADHITAHLFANGCRLPSAPATVEDFAVGEIHLAGGLIARLACSWKLPAGGDAVIGVSLFGTRGGLAFRNVAGSFYDFVAERYHGTTAERLCSPPDAWGGRAAISWVTRLARSARFDPDIDGALRVANTLDRLYGRA